MSKVFYIFQCSANLINLAKLNNIRLYQDNCNESLYNAKRSGKLVNYIPKWQQSWVFRLYKIDIKEIAIDITKIDKLTYQWPKNQQSMALNIQTSSITILSLSNSRLRHFNITKLCTHLQQLHINFSDDINWHFVYGSCQFSKANKHYN